ncbi:hypothetical protein Q4O78_03185 [Acinetobacter baumannii]|nr:hypothetical protein [Acinetobacter baumannii]MDO5924680.1 hypothetical protein [Acinetobacter baumannii]
MVYDDNTKKGSRGLHGWLRSRIERYLRPVCYQNYPDHLLPLVLQNANPLGIARLVNGEMSKAAL